MIKKERAIPLGIGVLLGIVIVIGSVWSVEITNTQAFCISCHELEQTVYQEYLKSPHLRTESGVGASCPDCHVPREWFNKLVTKTIAIKDLYHHLAGTIDTPEKFEAHRLTMAERVWTKMQETDFQGMSKLS